MRLLTLHTSLPAAMQENLLIRCIPWNADIMRLRSAENTQLGAKPAGIFIKSMADRARDVTSMVLFYAFKKECDNIVTFPHI